MMWWHLPGDKKLQVLPWMHYSVVQEGWKSWDWRGIAVIAQPEGILQCSIGMIIVKGYIEYLCGREVLEVAYSLLLTFHIFPLPLPHRAWFHPCYLDKGTQRLSETFSRPIHWASIFILNFILNFSKLLMGFSQ